MIHYICGISGTGKSGFIIDDICRCTEKNIEPLIIIPDQFSFEYDKKLYSALGVEKYNMTDALTFSRLSDIIFRKYGGKSGQYADDLRKSVIMYQATDEVRQSLGFFSRQSSKPDFNQYMLEIIKEFKKCNITPDLINEKSGRLNPQLCSKMQDIALIYSEYESILEKNNLKDRLNDISEAAEIAAVNGFFRGMTIYIDEFESFPADELEMIETIISQCSDIYIALRTDNSVRNETVFTSAKSAYSKLKDIEVKYSIKSETIDLKKAYRFKSPDIAHLSANIYRSDRISVYENPAENIKIIEAKDFYQESEFICSEICRLVKDEKYHFNDFAIVSRYPEEYSGIFEACFKRYHIPFFMDIEKSVMHTSVMLLITNLLEIISVKKPDTETILKLAKTQLLGIDYEQISALENYCYEWNIQGYTWLSPFTAGLEERPFIEEIRAKLIDPVTNLRQKCTKATGLQICTALFEYLEEMNIPENISLTAYSYKENGNNHMANELKRLWGNLMDMLDVLADILSDTIISTDSFSSLLHSMLSQNKYNNPPHSLDSVSFSDASRARFNEPRAVFVIGTNEGFFPAAAKQGGLLSENDRNNLNSGGITLSKTFGEIISDENFTFYKSISAPSEKLYITYPLSDVKGSSRFPSGILNTIQAFYSNNLTKYISDFGMDFYSCTPEAAYYNYVQQFNKNSSETAGTEYVLNNIPLYRDKISYLKSIEKDYDFRLENKKLIRKALTNKLHISATKFEKYNYCHFSFYCNYILKINRRTKRDLSGIFIGNLVHQCLENILKCCPSKESFTDLSAEKIKSMIAENMNSFRENEFGGNFAKTARFEANYRKIKDTVYEIVIHLQEEFAQSEFRPVNYELVISERNGDSPVKLITPNGMEVILNGKIDRVDMFEHEGKKYIRIIDYKSRNKKFSLENLLYGIDMQMFIYLFSVISPTGRYNGSIPAGALYLPYSETSYENSNTAVNKKSLKNKNYRMQGVVLQDKIVLNAMENEIQGIYIPARAKKPTKKNPDDFILTENSSYLSEKQFKNLEKFLRKQICELTENLYSGDISANPFITDKNSNCCTYCDYKEICGNASEMRSRTREKDAENKIKEIVENYEE